MNRLKPLFILLLLLIAFSFNSCNVEKEKIVIAISKATPVKYYGNYPKWIHKADSEVQIINMYELGLDSALKVLDNCDGLLITGGADVYPGWYNKLADTARCGSFDFYRDSLEISLIKKAIKKEMPLVGVCRGEQIINVALGGSLIIDIPSDHDTIVKHRIKDWRNCYHSVVLVNNSFLERVCNPTKYQVNSNHHQAIDRLAVNLKASAFSKDGIIEAVEWKEQKEKGFLLAVQWHPERLDSVNASLSLPIIREFIIEASKYHQEKAH